MDGLKKAYYRTYQQVFDIGMRCLHWRKPIVFSGAGCLKQVPDVLGKCGVEKVMVVTGSHVVKSLGPKLFAALEEAGMPYEVFSEVEANPSVTTVEKIRAQYVETGCSGFVALGGGSPMDATKGAAARVACPKKSCNDMAGVMRVGKTVPPIVAIPTRPAPAVRRRSPPSSPTVRRTTSTRSWILSSCRCMPFSIRS